MSSPRSGSSSSSRSRSGSSRSGSSRSESSSLSNYKTPSSSPLYLRHTPSPSPRTPRSPRVMNLNRSMQIIVTEEIEELAVNGDDVDMVNYIRNERPSLQSINNAMKAVNKAYDGDNEILQEVASVLVGAGSTIAPYWNEDELKRFTKEIKKHGLDKREQRMAYHSARGDFQGVFNFLGAGAIEVNHCFKLAAVGGHVDVMKLLFKHGATNYRETYNIAVRRRSYDAVWYLLQLGIMDPNHALALASRSGNDELVNYINDQRELKGLLLSY